LVKIKQKTTTKTTSETLFSEDISVHPTTPQISRWENNYSKKVSVIPEKLNVDIGEKILNNSYLIFHL